MPARKAKALHFGYSTNVHPSETIAEMRRFLSDYTIPVRRRVFGRERCGLELRCGIAAARELRSRAARESFGEFLEENGLDIFSINAFPLKDFQARRVKQEVYAPDWTRRDRVHWTIEIARIFADLLPASRAGSISTSAGTYRPWSDSPATHRKIARNYLLTLWALEEIHRETGRDIVLCAEPEPDTTLDTSEGAIRFFEDVLWPAAREEWKGRFRSRARLEETLRHRFTINFDTCHFSVLFERPARALAALERAGIGIGKIHVTNALALRRPHRSPRGYETFRGMHEARYLHQFCGVDSRGKTLWRGRDLDDLPRSLPRDLHPDLEELRTHFHVPLFLKRWKNLRTTQEETREALRRAVRRRQTAHVVFETYTWPVLTAEDRLLAGLTREFRWMLGAIEDLL